MSLLLGLSRGFETLADVLQYGPIDAIRINTSTCPEAERAYREVMTDLKPLMSNNPIPISRETPDDQPMSLLPMEIAEIVSNRVSIEDISKNLSAAVHEFGIEAEEDKQLIKCFITAFMKRNELIGKDIIDAMLESDEDKELYLVILQWMDSAVAGKPLSISKDSTINAEVVEELKKFIEWELSYIKDITTSMQAIKIQNGFEEILKNLQDLKEDITPIVVVAPEDVKPKSGFMDEEKQELIKKLKEAFSDILKDYSVEGLLTYKFNIVGEIAELLIVDKDFKNAPSRFRIDPGTMYGNGFNLIYWAPDATDGVYRDIYINIQKHPDIVKNIIDHPSYSLTVDEIQKVLVDSFSNKWIYYYVDMSSFSKHLSTLKPANLNKLEGKLSAVANVMFADNNIPRARLRLKSWKGVDNLTFVSDNECRSPFAMSDNTCRYIIPGMEISVVKDDITVKYPDENGITQTVKFTITN